MVHDRSKHNALLEQPNIRRWYDNLARGSVITAEVYLRALGAFCQRYKITPVSLTKMKEEKLYNFLLDFVSGEEKRKLAGSSIQTTIKVLRSWLAHNGVKMTRKIKIKGSAQTPTLVDERVPTQEELNRILLSATPRDRVCCAFMSFSGLRPESIGNYRGDDGLRLRDLPEVSVEGKTVKIETIPTMIVVRPELSKTRRQYFTFLGEEGCLYLKAFLEERLRSGEKLQPESDIIHPKVAEKRFVRTINIGDGIRTAIRGAGFKGRPYVLRAYFDTQLLLAESKGKITHTYRQFFMGHVGDMEARYTTNKGRLTKDMIEDMREAYKRCQTFLQTAKKTGKDEEELKDAFRKELLKVAGVTEKELQEMDIASMTDAEIHEMLRKRLLGAMANNGNRQKVVLLGEVENYIQQGWEYVGSLANDKAIMKLPDSVNGAFQRP